MEDRVPTLQHQEELSRLRSTTFTLSLVLCKQRVKNEEIIVLCYILIHLSVCLSVLSSHLALCNLLSYLLISLIKIWVIWLHAGLLYGLRIFINVSTNEIGLWFLVLPSIDQSLFRICTHSGLVFVFKNFYCYTFLVRFYNLFIYISYVL